VNYVFRVSKLPGARDLCVTSGASTMQTALGEDLRPSGTMNGAIYAAPSHETRVRGVHDHVGLRVRRDVTEMQRDARHADECNGADVQPVL